MPSSPPDAAGNHDKCEPSDLLGRSIAAVLLFLDSDENACAIGFFEASGGGYAIRGDDFCIPMTEEMLGRVRRFEMASVRVR